MVLNRKIDTQQYENFVARDAINVSEANPAQQLADRTSVRTGKTTDGHNILKNGYYPFSASIYN